MKKVILPVYNTIRATIKAGDTVEQTVLPDGTVMSRFMSVDLGQSHADYNTARDNGARVIYATIYLEKIINEIIIKYLSPEQTEEGIFLRNEIIESNTITFNFKKKLLQKINDIRHVITGKEKDKFVNYLKRVMDFRNAFAHGEILHDANKGFTLSYYSDRQIQVILDDDYWNDLEKCYSETETCLNILLTSLKKG